MVHNIGVDCHGQVYGFDRENDRIRIFNEQGKFIRQWMDCRRLGDAYISKQDVMYVAEQGSPTWSTDEPTVRVSIRDLGGKLLSQ